MDAPASVASQPTEDSEAESPAAAPSGGIWRKVPDYSSLPVVPVKKWVAKNKQYYHIMAQQVSVYLPEPHADAWDASDTKACWLTALRQSVAACAALYDSDADPSSMPTTLDELCLWLNMFVEENRLQKVMPPELYLKQCSDTPRGSPGVRTATDVDLGWKPVLRNTAEITATKMISYAVGRVPWPTGAKTAAPSPTTSVVTSVGQILRWRPRQEQR